MIEALVQKYGKPLIEELFDMMVIGGKVSNDYMRNLLLKHKVIKRSTKMIHSFVNSTSYNKVLYVRNGKNQNIISIRIDNHKIPEVMSMLNNY